MIVGVLDGVGVRVQVFRGDNAGVAVHVSVAKIPTVEVGVMAAISVGVWVGVFCGSLKFSSLLMAEIMPKLKPATENPIGAKKNANMKTRVDRFNLFKLHGSLERIEINRAAGDPLNAAQGDVLVRHVDDGHGKIQHEGNPFNEEILEAEERRHLITRTFNAYRIGDVHRVEGDVTAFKPRKQAGVSEFQEIPITPSRIDLDAVPERKPEFSSEIPVEEIPQPEIGITRAKTQTGLNIR